MSLHPERIRRNKGWRTRLRKIVPPINWRQESVGGSHHGCPTHSRIGRVYAHGESCSGTVFAAVYCLSLFLSFSAVPFSHHSRLVANATEAGGELSSH